jgi:hypothetical protein
MAELLKRQYNLVVLKVEIRPTQPGVLFTLQAKVDGAMTDVRVWLSSISELGLNRDLSNARGTRGVGTLPAAMVSEIAQWMKENIHDGQPLWVHLVKPYGVLRFMPWERAFGSTFGHAILMLPDFLFPPPRESSDVLDVALCASAPLNVEEGFVREALHDAIGGIMQASVRRTELHVFTDTTLYNEVRAASSLISDSNVRLTLYDPADAAPYTSADLSSRLVDRTGQLRSPWLLWMRNALTRHSVDVVHMVGHGYLTRDRGALLLAQSPLERTGDFRAGPVSAIELCNFMTQVGAWGTVLTGVRDNYSPMGLRALADEIGQSRPGPVLMHSLDRDPHQALLAPAYRLLFDTAPSSMPVSEALFVYCQPYRVGSAAGDPFEVGTQRYARNDLTLESPVSRNYAQSASAEEASRSASALDPIIQRAGPVKPWVAATERVAEQVQLRLQKNARDDDDDDPVQHARKNASISMLDSLRQSVAAFADEDAAAERTAEKAAAKSPLTDAAAPAAEGGTA